MLITQPGTPLEADVDPVEDGGGAPAFSQWRRLFFLWLLTLLILTPVLMLGGYLTFAQQYQRDRTLASASEQHLHIALNLLTHWSAHPFEVSPVRQAGNEFRTSDLLLHQIQEDLPELSWISVEMPMLGSRLTVAASLVRAAQGISQAGVAGCQLLESLLPDLANPFSTHSQGLTTSDMETINRLFPQIRNGLSLALDNVEPLRPSDLAFDAHLSQMFGAFQHDLPGVRNLLQDATLILPALPSLLGIGQPAQYLLEMLDSSELRPGGGFVGSDGTITLNGGHFSGAQVQDVLVLDNQTRPGGGFFLPFPPQYGWFQKFLSDVSSWSLRDSNLEPDFPTSARNGEVMYDLEGGQARVQGVVAITPMIIQNVLKITGPIAMPEYGETVTADNLVALIHYHQLGAGSEGNSAHLTADGQTTLRKHFVEVLSQHIMERFHQLSAGELSKFITLLVNSLHSRDVQIYLNNPVAEKMLDDMHLSGSVQAPQTGDSLLVVDTNIGGNKANAFITTSRQDEVMLNNMGDALHHLTLTYVWTQPGNIYSTRGYYHDYLRLYVPPDSVLNSIEGLTNPGSSSGFGRTIWSGDFRLNYGQTITLTFTWRVPHASVPAGNQPGWHYQYLLQRQAGILWQSNLKLQLAGCGQFSAPMGGLRLLNTRQAAWQNALDRDMTLSANYVC